jgi:hypothetical protein
MSSRRPPRMQRTQAEYDAYVAQKRAPVVLDGSSVQAAPKIDRTTQLVLQAMFVESVAGAGWEVSVQRTRGEYVDLDARVALALMAAQDAYARVGPVDFVSDAERHIAVCRYAGLWCALDYKRHARPASR